MGEHESDAVTSSDILAIQIVKVLGGRTRGVGDLIIADER